MFFLALLKSYHIVHCRTIETSQKSIKPQEAVEELQQQPDSKALEQVARIESKTRRKRSRRVEPATFTNQFSTIAPLWFYSLVAQFMKHKDNDALWSGGTGSQLLAHIFRTLATFVEFSGVQCAPILAKDLIDLVWSFRTADRAEVRLAVLVSVATSVSMLPEEATLAWLYREQDSLPQIMSDISSSDPDSNCRNLALTISSSIVDVMRSVAY